MVPPCPKIRVTTHPSVRAVVPGASCLLSETGFTWRGSPFQGRAVCPPSTRGPCAAPCPRRPASPWTRRDEWDTHVPYPRGSRAGGAVKRRLRHSVVVPQSEAGRHVDAQKGLKQEAPRLEEAAPRGGLVPRLALCQQREPPLDAGRLRMSPILQFLTAQRIRPLPSLSERAPDDAHSASLGRDPGQCQMRRKKMQVHVTQR